MDWTKSIGSVIIEKTLETCKYSKLNLENFFGQPKIGDLSLPVPQWKFNSGFVNAFLFSTTDIGPSA